MAPVSPNDFGGYRTICTKWYAKQQAYPRASGINRSAGKRPSGMTSEALPVHDHGYLDLALSDLANADQA